MHPFSVITTDAAAAAWNEYPQPQLGCTIEFPAQPVLSQSVYHTAVIPSATAHILSLTQKDTLFAATVVDLPDREPEAPIFLGEAESVFAQLGDVVSVSISRVQLSHQTIYGRLITLQCRARRAADAVRAWFKSNTGSDPIHPSRVVANLIFNRGRLYLLHGISIPGTDDASSLPAVLRFVNSITFGPDPFR